MLTLLGLQPPLAQHLSPQVQQHALRVTLSFSCSLGAKIQLWGELHVLSVVIGSPWCGHTPVRFTAFSPCSVSQPDLQAEPGYGLVVCERKSAVR